mmetsp:Transcript_86056/g.229653  ORF Transcript_86056/g.229653 Transcript_86056/m.229653 type:complete len:123 (-) Transcript_86056:142-510(-)
MYISSQNFALLSLIFSFPFQVEVDMTSVRDVEKLGFARQYVVKCVNNNRHNLVSTCYWLINMKRTGHGGDQRGERRGEIAPAAPQTAPPLKPRPPTVDRHGSTTLSNCTTYRRLGVSEIDVA